MSNNPLSKVSWLMFEWILFLYVAIGFALSHLLPIPEMAKSILSLPSWLIIPYFFGSCFRLVLRHFRVESFAGIQARVFSLLFGIYLLIVVTFLLDLLGLSVILVNLYLLVLATAVIYLVYKTFRKVGDEFPVRFETYGTYTSILVFCLLVSIIPAIMKVSASPFPYGTVETISIPSEQYQPALRFMEYGYLQHYRVYDYVSLALSSQLLNIDPLSFIWSSPFLMMAVYSFGLFLFAYAISKSKGFSLLAVFIGSFLNMNVFRDAPLLFRSNVFLYIFLPFILYLSYKNISKKEYRMKDVVITLLLFSAVAVFYVYLIEGDIWSAFVPKNLVYPAEWRSHVWLPTIVVTTAPVLSFVGYSSRFFAKKNSFLADNALLLMFIPFFSLAFLNIEAIAFIFFIFSFVLLFFITRNKKTRLLLYVFLAFAFVIILFQRYVMDIKIINSVSSIILPNVANSLDYFYFSFSSRFSWIFENNLTPILIVVLILGIIASVVSKRRQDTLIISAFSLALFLYLFPETYAYRFYKELSIMMACVMSVGLWRIFNAVVDSRKRYSTLIFSTLIVIVLLPSLITPVYQRYYQSFLGQSMLSDYEYSAAKWVRENTPANTLLISDYVTMELLAPLSDKMLPVARSEIIQGLSQSDIQTVWRIKNLLTISSSNYALENSSKASFWSTYGFGKGSFGVKIENATQESENGTIKISVTEGGQSVFGVVHRFSEKQNWSNASGLYLNWYGGNTGSSWQICIVAPDDQNWFGFNFVDNFIGWKRISVQFSDFSKVNSPNWANVSYITIRSSNAMPSSWLLGEVGLSYVNGVNINYNDINYLKENISSTEERYSEQTGIPIENRSVLIVLTPRTVEWVKQEGISEIWSMPQEPLDNSYLELFKKNSSLQLVYSYRNDIYIFKVK